MKRLPITFMVLMLAGIGISFSLKASDTDQNIAPDPETTSLHITNQPESGVFKPLDWIEITGAEKGVIVVYDGTGREYARGNAGETFKFQVGGSLGTQTAFLMNKKEQVVERITFKVDCQTEIDDAGGEYSELMDILYWTMVKGQGETEIVRYEGEFYSLFVRWLRDHVHTMKGMKYFYPELKSGIDLYAKSQREDGMIWDNIYPRTKEKNYSDKRFGYAGFIRPIENSTYEFKRIPVEADVEYLFFEGLYYTWKATGDDAWMASKLDNAMLALKYCTTDEYRWSEKYQLVKRGFTIDTWDFQADEDAAITGDIMVIDKDKTRFGVMFGDNTGLIVGCRYLSEMLDHAGRASEAREVRQMGRDIKQRLDQLSWNGRFYTHHVPEDPGIVRDLGVDHSRLVSLSNAYSLNRDLTREQCRSIIRTYQEIRREMPESSPGEWYAIYPPFERGFNKQSAKWEYVNGGVTPIVAGELAHGAFENGYEEYGVDILNRLKALAKKTDNYLHCTYRGAKAEPPERDFTKLDIQSVANTDFSGEGADGVPGWTGQGGNDLQEMITGELEFHDIPFTVIDPEDNGRRACLGLSGASGYASQSSLSVGETAGSIYLLHTKAGGAMAGSVTLQYEDGSSYTDYIASGKIGGWWMPNDPPRNRKMPVCKVAWRGGNEVFHNVGVFVYGLNNPHPEKVIKSIDFEGVKNNTKWFVLGITLSDAPVFFDPGAISYGIPDNWGAAAVVYALVEGLAGVKDDGVAFDRALLSPRWSASEVSEVNATIKYEASGGYLSYSYKHDAERQELDLQFTGTADETKAEVLLPKALQVYSVTLDGEKVNHTLKQVGESAYVCLDVDGPEVHHLKIHLTSYSQAAGSLLKIEDIRIRDPFIYADQKSKTYFMYAQSANRAVSDFTGVEVYISKDLINWKAPRPVLTLPDNAGIKSVWAPEMHQYNGKFYLFVTLTLRDTLPENKPVEKDNWPGMHIRGTHLYYADSPLGPFQAFKGTSHTPEEWMALDGTLFIEEGKPYMVFCHEWVQTIDGTMDYVQLKDDLSGTIGEPQLMFKASAAPGARQSPELGKVTDGCFLYRSMQSNRLFMIWSTMLPEKGYCVLLTHSESGKISGPWKEQKIIYEQNGGHGMIFSSFDDQLMMALHQPNSSPGERLHLFQITESGDTMDIKNEVDLN